MKHISDSLNNRSWEPPTTSSEGLPTRPKGKPTRLWLDNEYFKEGYGATFPHSVFLVYGVLAMHANARTQICYPPTTKIMKLTRITNRNTVFEAIKILEAHNLIEVKRSKGRFANRYRLLSASVWKKPNSDIVDTVKKTKKNLTTVSELPPQQSQNTYLNGSTGDTRNHIKDSENINHEPNKENATSKEVVSLTVGGANAFALSRLSGATQAMIKGYFEEMDLIAAINDIEDSGESISIFALVNSLSRRKAVPIKPMKWPPYPSQNA